jgi:hypothetical protein
MDANTTKQKTKKTPRKTKKKLKNALPIKPSLFTKERRSIIEKSLLIDNSMESYVKSFSTMMREEHTPWA